MKYRENRVYRGDSGEAIEVYEYLHIYINEGVKSGSIYHYECVTLEGVALCVVCLVWYKSSISLFIIKSKEFS